MGKLFIQPIIFLSIFFSCQNSDSTKGVSSDLSHIDHLITYSINNQGASTDTVLTLLRQANLLAKEINYQDGIALSSLRMGQLLFKMGGYSLSAFHLNEALNIYHAQNNLQQVAEVTSILGELNQYTGNKIQGLNFYRKSLLIFSELKDQKGIALQNGKIGSYYEKEQRYDSALYFQKLALNFFKLSADQQGLAAIHDNLGSIYEDQGIYDLAFYHFTQALNLNQTLNNKSAIVINLNNIGDVYRKQEMLDSALMYSLKALELSKQVNLPYQTKSANRDLSKIYAQKADNERALYYLDQAYVITDELFNQQIAEEIAKTRSVYELQQKQQRIQFLEDQRRQSQFINIGIFMSAIGFIVLGILVYKQQKSKNEKKQKLLETELENKKLKEEHLQNELYQNGKSLTNNTLQMVQKNKFLQDLRSRLKELKIKNDGTVTKKIAKMIKLIDRNLQMDQEWKEFETIFQQVHADFFNALMDKYPGLSPAESRLCAMIKLNLHSRDVAAIMSISHDSLRIARYRLRKKLKLENGENLYTHLNNIGRS